MVSLEILPTTDPEAAWYCVRSQIRHEHIAAANLRRHLQIEVFHPRIRFKRPTRRGLVWVNESLFPNYLFARFSRTAVLAKVQHTSGVAKVVHFGSFWPTIPEGIVAELRAAVGQDETRVMEEPLRPGDEVQIVGGAFDGFRAVVTRVLPARQRVAVLLDFLGRQTVVELDHGSVSSDAAWCAVRASCSSAA
jgi:transcriptional antiterminator RfaH